MNPEPTSEMSFLESLLVVGGVIVGIMALIAALAVTLAYWSPIIPPTIFAFLNRVEEAGERRHKRER